MHPELYREECHRAQARFDEAVRLAGTAFTEELSKLIEHLQERLAGSGDGKPKVFRDSAVENLREFLDRFRQLSIGSDEQLDAVVRQAESLLGDTPAPELRNEARTRQWIAQGLAEVRTALDPLLVDRPRRKILRTPR